MWGVFKKRNPQVKARFFIPMANVIVANLSTESRMVRVFIGILMVAAEKASGRKEKSGKSPVLPVGYNIEEANRVAVLPVIAKTVVAPT